MVTAAKRFASVAYFEEALAALRGMSPMAVRFYCGPSPEELYQIYSQGFQAVRPDLVTPEDQAAIDRTFGAAPTFYEVFPWAKGIGKGKVNVAYYPILHFSPAFGGDEAQTRGSCTVHSTANAAEADHAQDALFGETEYMGRLVKENIYRSRGFNQDGWSCRAPATYIGPEGRGGLLYRKEYSNGNDSIDFTKFSAGTENWAGNGRAGVPAWLEEESRKNKAKLIIRVTSMEEYRDAIAIGFGISVCSGQGFASSTDQYGVSEARGSWSHAMAHLLCVDTEWAHKLYADMIGGIQQSWGRWNKQNGKPEGVAKMPVGMFCGRASVISRMIRGGDSFIVCDVHGWSRKGFEAVTSNMMLEAMQKDSTVRDYYKTRQEKNAEYTEKMYHEFNTAV